MPQCLLSRLRQAWRQGQRRKADALNFLVDAGNYAISFFVVGMALRYRATAAFLKGATMGVFGVWVLGVTA